jgi:hypothetical protein
MLRGATKRVSLVKSVRRSWPLLLAATGLVVFCGGFVYDVAFAGIPYQDPTPEMAADFARHARVASLIRWVGLGLLLSGAITSFARRLARREERRSVAP